MALTNNSAKSVGPGAIVNPSSLTSWPSFSGVVNTVKSIAGSNTAASAQQAADLRDWQVEQARIAREFNAREAQKNRDWQERMSNTAHQREVNDLVAAGLNPVLSALGGNGAAVTSGASASTSAPSGAMGDVDRGATSGLSSLFGSLLSSLLSLEGARVSAESNQAIADKYTAMSKYTAELGSATQLTTANIQAAAQKYVAGLNLAGTKYSADKHAAATQAAAAINAAAQRYAADRHLQGSIYQTNVNSMTQKELAIFNGYVNAELQKRGFEHDFDMKSAFPSSPFDLIGSLMDIPFSDHGRGVAGFFNDIAGSMANTDFGKWLNGGFTSGGSLKGGAGRK
ncbi:DNA pilot protein [Gokushovirinae sp.]|nr:DNA pilot protein [Gokushovirinae sp.]